MHRQMMASHGINQSHGTRLPMKQIQAMSKSGMLQVAFRSSFLTPTPIFPSVSLSNSWSSLSQYSGLYHSSSKCAPDSNSHTAVSQTLQLNMLAFWAPNSKGVVFVFLFFLSSCQMLRFTACLPSCLLLNKICLQLNKKGGVWSFSLMQYWVSYTSHGRWTF